MDKETFHELQQKILNNKLCVSCGACVAVCPQEAITIRNELPISDSRCIRCGQCYRICPVKDMINPSMFDGKEIKDAGSYLGSVCDVAICRVNSKERLLGSSSGGIVTYLLSRLFKIGEIDGALVLVTDRNNPLGLNAIIATSEKDILSSAQSKYICHPSLQTIRCLKNLPSHFKLAVVGLPCQINALSRMHIESDNNINIAYKFSLYCGGVLEGAVLDYILNWFKVKKDDVKSVEYRHGIWPGYFRIVTKDRPILIHKHAFNLFYLTHLKRGCLICSDFTGEHADLSFGDAWISRKIKEKIWNGNTIILARNKIGMQLLDMLRNSNDVVYQRISKEEAILRHIHSIDNKKIGSIIRKKLIFKEFSLDGINYWRVLFEKVYWTTLNFSSNPIGRFLISRLPIKLWHFLIVNIREAIIKSKEKMHHAAI